MRKWYGKLTSFFIVLALVLCSTSVALAASNLTVDVGTQTVQVGATNVQIPITVSGNSTDGIDAAVLRFDATSLNNEGITITGFTSASGLTFDSGNSNPSGGGIILNADDPVNGYTGSSLGSLVLSVASDATLGTHSITIDSGNSSISDPMAGSHTVVWNAGSITVTAAPVAPSITTSSLPNGTVGTAYSQTLAATGDIPIIWSIDSGSLPAGLSLSGDTISGTPTTAENQTFTVKAMNAAGDDSKSLSITVSAVPAAPAITTSYLPDGTVGTAYSQTLAATGDTPITWTIESGSLPAGLSLTDDTISGTPTTAENQTFTIKASNAVGDDSKALSIAVTVAPTYTVSFNSNGGSDVPDITGVVSGAKITAPAAPTFSGYTFSGWYKEPALKTIWNFATDTVTADITLYARWISNSGGGSGSDSSSNGSSGGSGLPDTAVSTTPGITWITSSDAKNSTRSIGQFGIRANAWAKLGNTPSYHDTMDGSAVQVRVKINNPSLFKKDAMLSAYVKGPQVDQIKGLFSKWFKNKVQVIHFDQQANWEQPVEIAAKIDLSGMDIKNLVIYSYNKATNSYTKITSTEYWIDKNGYLHFSTQLAGDIIITDKLLTKK